MKKEAQDLYGRHLVLSSLSSFLEARHSSLTKLQAMRLKLLAQCAKETMMSP
jgi:hypothetical protein